ncbi:MAG: hypothetical protein LH603_12955 [Pseudonocardia sp.]|nr:hypothetical protein [Pseudonocardia sp.]
MRSDVGSGRPVPVERPLVVRPGWVPLVLSGLLVVVAAAAAGFSLFVPALLSGAEVTRGNLRGTALVVLVALPVLVASVISTVRGSARGLVVWLGTLGYLLYQAVLFCFATPLNSLFLAYIGYLGLSLWSLVTLLRATDLDGFGARLSPGMPARPIAGVALGLAVLNTVAWLAPIVPAVLGPDPSTLVGDTGLLTNPVYVQDLAVWLPLLTAAAVATWRRRTWGLLVTGAMLVMFVLESAGIATDQWFGSQADPTSGSASMSAVPVFAVLALVLAVPVVWYLRHVDRAPIR